MHKKKGSIPLQILTTPVVATKKLSVAYAPVPVTDEKSSESNYAPVFFLQIKIALIKLRRKTHQNSNLPAALYVSIHSASTATLKFWVVTALFTLRIDSNSHQEHGHRNSVLKASSRHITGFWKWSSVGLKARC